MRKKILLQIFKFQKKNCCPPSLVLSLLGHNFCSHAPIEKIYIPMKIICLSIFQKVSKNHDKKSACQYLSGIPFVPQRDNGPLGVKQKI